MVSRNSQPSPMHPDRRGRKEQILQTLEPALSASHPKKTRKKNWEIFSSYGGPRDLLLA
jgi:hypothetical protein